MIKRYKMPIQGTALKREPLTGISDDPISVIALDALPNFPGSSFGYICLNYNIDEEWCEIELEASENFHNWLTNLLPQLRDIQKQKGQKLDKSKMVEKLENK